ncbi:YgfZ/GcvT domain-containing protein, partial [Leucobacter soli]
MSDPFLDLPGAIAASDLDAAAHFGAPLPEQRALEAGNAIVSLAHRGAVTVSGPDRLSWLHSMTSQQLTGLRPGESTETLLLGPTGRVEQAIRVVDDGERAWLLVDEGAAEPLAAYLNRMRFALRVEVADVSGEYAAVLAFEGGAALPALRELGTAVAEWRDPWGSVQRGGVQYAHGAHPGEGWTATQLVFRREDLSAAAALTTSGEIRAAGLMALDALEVRAGRPTLHAEADERAIPHEFDWLRTAVHLTKGCYRGQETVAKVHNLGHPPRRLALLHLDGSGGELPEAGALVHVAGADPD